MKRTDLPPVDPELRAVWDEATKANEGLGLEELELKRRRLRIEFHKKLVEVGGFTRRILASSREIAAASGDVLPLLDNANLPDATLAAASLREASERSELKRRDRVETFLATLPTGDSAEKLVEWVEQIGRLESNTDLLFEGCDVACARLLALRKAASAAATVLQRIDAPKAAEAAGKLIALSGPQRSGAP